MEVMYIVRVPPYSDGEEMIDCAWLALCIFRDADCAWVDTYPQLVYSSTEEDARRMALYFALEDRAEELGRYIDKSDE